jgi:hypothetical protein
MKSNIKALGLARVETSVVSSRATWPTACQWVSTAAGATAQQPNRRCRKIHEPLTKLLADFGPKRRDYYPNMPFWRLRTDGFWTLENTEGCKSRKGNTQPTKPELIENKALLMIFFTY